MNADIAEEFGVIFAIEPLPDSYRLLQAAAGLDPLLNV